MLGVGGVVAGLLPGASGEVVQAADPKPSSLKITKVETFALQHKLERGIAVSIGPFGKTRDCLLCKITTDSGLIGWGETADVGGTRGIIEDHLKGILLGKNPLEYRKLWRELWGENFGDGRAVACVDIALNDLRGKALGLPISELFGGRVRSKIMPYAAAMNYAEGIRAEDKAPPEAASLVKDGFLALKIRTGRYENKRDLAILAKIRETVGPDIRLLTDGNAAFTIPQAVKFGKELEKLDFYCWEEPIPQGFNYEGYTELTRTLDIAVSGGEALDSRSSAKDHIVKRSFDIIQPDTTLCGGMAECLFIAEMARLYSVQCVPHCWGSAIAIAATMQVLSLLPPYTLGATSDEPMLEFDTNENPFRTELLTTKPFAIVDGQMTIPTGPGLGVDVNEEIIKKYQVKR